MNNSNNNQIRKILLMLALSALMLAQVGCSQDTPLTPGTSNTSEAPVLPDPQRLSVDLGFFADGKSADKSQNHFFNAYLRAVIVTAMTELVLAPPVAAFSVALHTPPSHQADGSWIWVYTHVQGLEEVQIRLHGLPVDDGVQWSLYVSDNNPAHPINNELWFDGSTANEGDEGAWTFYDFNLDGKPAVAELQWGESDRGTYLSLTALEGEDAGNVLTYLQDGPLCSIEFQEAVDGNPWYIRWNEDDGTGSLQVPDYNYGEVGCWDSYQQDRLCP